jgi:hypothetical protein
VKNLVAIMAVVGLVACAKNMDAGSALVLANAGFEETSGDGGIAGWTTVQHAGPTSYEMVVEEPAAYAGHASFRMTRTRDQVYGSILQDVSVDKSGGLVELSAMLKTGEVGPQGWGLLLQTPQLSKFSPKLVGTSDWQRVTVRATLPPGTTSVTIGATLLDGGSGWMDDVQLKAIAPGNL